MLFSTSMFVVQHVPVLLSTNEADSPPLLLPRYGLRHSISVEFLMLMFAGGPVYTHSACALEALLQQNEFVMVGVWIVGVIHQDSVAVVDVHMVNGGSR